MFIWATTSKMNQLQLFSGFISFITRLNSGEEEGWTILTRSSCFGLNGGKKVLCDELSDQEW